MKTIIMFIICLFLIMITKEVRIEIVTYDIIKLDNLLDDSIRFRTEN
jgi:hypothetical protein